MFPLHHEPQHDKEMPIITISMLPTGHFTRVKTTTELTKSISMPNMRRRRNLSHRETIDRQARIKERVSEKRETFEREIEI